MPEVALRRRARARLAQFIYPYVVRVNKDLYFATRPVAEPGQIHVPTRHGPIRCLVYRPTGRAACRGRSHASGPP